MDISNEATIIKNKQILDKFSINIHLIKNIIYVLTFIGLFITLYVTFFPVKSSFNTQKMRRLKYMLFDKHWIMMFFIIICINILVNVVKVDTMNDSFNWISFICNIFSLKLRLYSSFIFYWIRCMVFF